MTHPLTDEICDQIQDSIHPCDPADMRAAAADWQLEQDAEWWKTFLDRTEMIPAPVVNLIIEDFKQAMRPTNTQEDKQTADSAPWLGTTYDGFKHR